MLRQLGIAAVLLIAAGAAAQQVTITGAEGATLRSLVNSGNLVTVVLSIGDNIEDPNVRITEYHPTFFKGSKPGGEEVTYTYEMVRALRVQDSAVTQTDFDALRNRALSTDQIDVVNLGWDRLERLFSETDRNQGLKIQIAGVLGFRGNSAALEYLQRLTDSNDLGAQFDAAAALYLAGQPIPEGLLRSGFESGRLDIQGYAAKLAGLVGDREALPYIQRLAQDRAAELSGPAVVALARLGERSVVPRLISMLTDVNAAKGEAALTAIRILGDESLVEELTPYLGTTEGGRRFRVVHALHILGAERGTRELEAAIESDPTHARDAARLLAADGNWPATQFLRDRLNRRMDPTEINHMNRVLNAAALIAGGDTDASAVLQNMLAVEQIPVKVLVCTRIARLQKRNLMTLLRPGIQNVSPAVAYHACAAAISYAEPEFRERLFGLGF